MKTYSLFNLLCLLCKLGCKIAVHDTTILPVRKFAWRLHLRRQMRYMGTVALVIALLPYCPNREMNIAVYGKTFSLIANIEIALSKRKVNAVRHRSAKRTCRRNCRWFTPRPSSLR